jgi:uncharacterized protein YvpB
MALELERFRVYLQDLNENITEHQVTVRHVDMLRGELENGRQGNPDTAKLNLITAWVWAACTRLGLYALSFPDFRDRDLIGLEDDGKETVDPTTPETPEGSA